MWFVKERKYAHVVHEGKYADVVYERKYGNANEVKYVW